jgi:hypothetical protein
MPERSARIAAIAWDPAHLAMQLFHAGSVGGEHWQAMASQTALSVMTGSVCRRNHGVYRRKAELVDWLHRARHP